MLEQLKIRTKILTIIIAILAFFPAGAAWAQTCTLNAVNVVVAPNSTSNQGMVTADAGQVISVTVVNTGSAPGSFTIRIGSGTLVSNAAVAPGDTFTASITLNSDEGGDFLFITNGGPFDFTVVCESTDNPALSIAKFLDNNADEDGSGTISLGDTLTYTVLAENIGNVSLTNVIVSDPLIMPATMTCPAVPIFNFCRLTGTYTVTQADVTRGTIENTGSAISTETPVPVTATLVIEVAQPSIAITKTLDANADEDGSGTISLGDTLTYFVVATNSGNVILTNVVVSDALIEPTSSACGFLQPNETCVLGGTYTVMQADVTRGTITNIGSAESDQTPEVTATLIIEVAPPEPSIAITKTVILTGDADGSGDITPGDTLTYTVTATNDGDVELTGVQVTDTLITPDSITCQTVPLDGTCVLVGTYVVDQRDADDNAVVNFAGALTAEGPQAQTTLETPVFQPPPPVPGRVVENEDTAMFLVGAFALDRDPFANLFDGIESVVAVIYDCEYREREIEALTKEWQDISDQHLELGAIPWDTMNADQKKEYTDLEKKLTDMELEIETARSQPIEECPVLGVRDNLPPPDFHSVLDDIKEPEQTPTKPDGFHSILDDIKEPEKTCAQLDKEIKELEEQNNMVYGQQLRFQAITKGQIENGDIEEIPLEFHLSQKEYKERLEAFTTKQRELDQKIRRKKAKKKNCQETESRLDIIKNRKFTTPVKPLYKPIKVAQTGDSDYGGGVFSLLAKSVTLTSLTNATLSTGGTKQKPWRLFLKGRLDGLNDNRLGTDRNANSFTVDIGAMRRVGRKTIIGGQVTLKDGSVKSTALNAELDSTFYGASLFVRRQLGKKTYFSGMVGYKNGDSDLVLDGETATFSTDVLTGSARLQTRIELDNLILTPDAQFTVTELKNSGFISSNGDIALEKKLTYTDLAVGGNLSHTAIKKALSGEILPGMRTNIGFHIVHAGRSGDLLRLTNGAFADEIGLGARVNGGIDIPLEDGMHLRFSGNYAFFDDVQTYTLQGRISKKF